MTSEEISDTLKKLFVTLKDIKNEEDFILNSCIEGSLGKGKITIDPKTSIQRNKIICLECGKEVKPALWGGKCHKDKVVHQVPCDMCGRLCGIIVDDDYQSAEKLICPDCMDKARAKNTEKA